MFRELDQVPENFLSVGSGGESTVDECLAGASKSLEEATVTRRLAYQRFVDWDDGTRRKFCKELLRKLKAKECKLSALADESQQMLTDYLVFEADRCRAELEVEHWRHLVDWWRARTAQGLERTYGRARSASELVRELADEKGAV